MGLFNDCAPAAGESEMFERMRHAAEAGRRDNALRLLCERAIREGVAFHAAHDGINAAIWLARIPRATCFGRPEEGREEQRALALRESTERLSALIGPERVSAWVAAAEER